MWEEYGRASTCHHTPLRSCKVPAVLQMRGPPRSRQVQGARAWGRNVVPLSFASAYFFNRCPDKEEGCGDCDLELSFV